MPDHICEETNPEHRVGSLFKESDDGTRAALIEHCEHGVLLVLTGSDLTIGLARAIAEAYLDREDEKP